jgi:hypothetical protein
LLLGGQAQAGKAGAGQGGQDGSGGGREEMKISRPAAKPQRAQSEETLFVKFLGVFAPWREILS